MTKTLMITACLAMLLSVSSGVTGGIVALHLYASRQSAAGDGVVRAQRVEIVDRNGKVRATLGLDRGDVRLQMMSADSKPLVSLGVLAADAQRISALESSGETRTFYPAPFLQMNNSEGETAALLTTGANGRGSLRFDANSKTGKVLLGYFEEGDLAGGPHDAGAWGLRIVGRGANGATKYTGIGILNRDGTDGQYLVPHFNSQAQP